MKRKLAIGIGRFDGGTDYAEVDVAFAAEEGLLPEDVYSRYDGQSVEVHITDDTGEQLELIDEYLARHAIQQWKVRYALHLTSGGWGMWEWNDIDGWDFYASVDFVQRREIDMCDQAYINDLRFGADSDGPDWWR